MFSAITVFAICFSVLVYSRRFRGTSKVAAVLSTIAAVLASVVLVSAVPTHQGPEAAGRVLFALWLAAGFYVGVIEQRMRRRGATLVAGDG